MPLIRLRDYSYESRVSRNQSRLRWYAWHVDPWLLLGISALVALGLVILYSASDQSLHMVEKQGFRLGIAVVLMLVCARLSPQFYRQWTPWLFASGILLLVLVLLIGHVEQGARRWLVLGPLRFQPSEIMKLAMPMMLAWYLGEKPLPPSKKDLLLSGILIAIPLLLTAKQPDLGTALMITAAGAGVILLAGIGWRLVASLGGIVVVSLPLLWHFLHTYQKERILTFLNPERDPLGAGYHIIQSKIAIGSGGFTGEGWLQGTQAHLSFLPEHATDFIFAVTAEEFGLIGCTLLIILFLAVLGRCLYIALKAPDGFSRLLVGGLAFSFFLSAFVNMSMVTGLLPVVGVPLPLISYGGSSLVTTLVGFGIIMSVASRRNLWSAR